MTRKDSDTRRAPEAVGRLHSPRLPRPTAMREHPAGRRQERSRQGRPMNAPWPNARTHRLFQVPECGCSQGQRLGVHPWRGRRTPANPSCQVHREASSQAPAHETAGTDSGLPAHLLRISFRDDECRPPVHAWSGKTRCAAGAPAPTAAAQEQAARIAEADMRADAFERVV
ncbi:hypothetical protein ACIQMV_24760 [Streptomyces sp. NPDC091412]|uniref:hypothetical protein n=1 Tax=Streptomyces sp. NPDC091412 TaxID=3366002 RepID=UPI00380CF023